MNRDEMIARAISVLDTAGIVKKDKNPEKLYIEKAFRGQISSFGAAVEMGSLLSAVAFFSSQGSSPTDRTKRFYISRIHAVGPDGISRQLPGSMEVIVR